MKLGLCVLFAIVAALGSFSFYRYGNLYFHYDGGNTSLDLIEEEAVRFVEAENLKTGTNWRVIGPNLKTIVPKCLVALHVQWASADLGFSNKTVLVICHRPPGGEKPWDIPVPVMQPQK